MNAPARVVHPLLVVGLVLVAVAGYVAGNHSVSTSGVANPPSATRSLSTSGLQLEYPISWQRAASATTIPGLALTGPVMLTPQGSPGTGLVTGQLPAGGAGPLPASFVAQLHRLPHVEVVDLVSTQAYRYSGLELPGLGSGLDLYVIPEEGGTARVMACVAPEQLTTASQECERIVSGVALTGPPTATLTPEPIYAKSLAALVTSLQAARARARKEMSTSSSVAEVAGAASGLASTLSAAASSLAALQALQAPQPAAAAGTALADALRRSGQAYTALATAARSEILSQYEAARNAVGGAESRVDAALANFALLGYGPA
jgi:hypothetical protein